MNLEIYTDGASRGNPGEAALGVVIYKDKEILNEISESLGIKTNNEAEYLAVLRALEQAHTLNLKSFTLYSDSQLLVRQLNGEYKVKSKTLKPLYEQIQSLKEHLQVTFQWIAREKNAHADALANKALDRKNEKDFSLVLSGGGAHGFAHIGAIKALEEKQKVPSHIVGTSMGAIIGSAYGVGFKPDDIVNAFSQYALLEELKNLFHISEQREKQVEQLLDHLFGELKLNETKIPLSIIATSLDSGEAVEFSSDSNIKIKDAIRASVAIPPIYSVVKFNKESFVDGYFSSNLAVEFAQYKSIIAVDVISANKPGAFKEKHLDKNNEALRIFQRMMFYKVKKESLAKKAKLDSYIKPDLADISPFSYHRFEEIIKRGYKETKHFI